MEYANADANRREVSSEARSPVEKHLPDVTQRQPRRHDGRRAAALEEPGV
jgi:hypothetical protein